MFPYLFTDGTLYFSSTGHAGLGGLDLFEVHLKGLKPEKAPQNLGAPLNSSEDDFGIIFNKDGGSGFFSSNRRGSDDIYMFSHRIYHIRLEGTVTDINTGLPIADSRVQLRYMDQTDTMYTDHNGRFKTPLRTHADYEVAADKETYSSDYTFGSSRGIMVDSVLYADLRLGKSAPPPPPPAVVITAPPVKREPPCDSLKRVFATGNIYYDLDKSDIRRDAHKVLDDVAELMKTHPEINLEAASYCDSRASSDYNIRLSLRRSQSAKDYIVSKGVSPDRITGRWYGANGLINACKDGTACSELEQQKNRRTEFHVILNGVNLNLMKCKP